MLLTLTCFSGFQIINYISENPPFGDSGIFSSISLQMLEGKILYKDVWDHKPPMIFIINAFALLLNGTAIDSVRLIERIMAAFSAFAMFLIIYKVFASAIISFLSTFFFLLIFYHFDVFVSGNHPEEYASIFIVIGVLFIIKARINKNNISPMFTALTGLLFSLACLTKETFLFSLAPWSAYLMLGKGEKGRLRTHILAFLIGLIIPISLLSLYFIANGAFYDWIDTTSFNFYYVKLFQHNNSLIYALTNNLNVLLSKVILKTVIGAVFFFAGLVSILDRKFVKTYYWFPLAAVSAFLMEFAATALSGRQFGHYYMQISASFIMISSCGAAFCLYYFNRLEVSKLFLFLFAVIVIFFFDINPVRQYIKWISLSASAADKTAIGQYITKTSAEGDLIWVSGCVLSVVYLETKRLSAAKYVCLEDYYLIDTLFSSKEDKINTVKEQLMRNRPKIIIVDDRHILEKINIMKWINDEYEENSDADKYVSVYLRND
ncbi:membrane protein [Candidatus Magnetoovum chiemensis]|nr:membrane protein [Candidatus Magnetoovum chiemensis]